MKAKAHTLLANFLIANNPIFKSRLSEIAFKFGSIEPDINFLTYFRKSRKEEKMRGHNYDNCVHHMAKLARILEKCKKYGVLRSYTMGKLLHYVADGFTFAHNSSFGENIRIHREYEMKHYDRLITELEFYSLKEYEPKDFEEIKSLHNSYNMESQCVANDVKYLLEACFSFLEFCKISKNLEIKEAFGI